MRFKVQLNYYKLINNVMRRGFITFLLAIAALFANVAFAQEKPILTFGCLSDLHSQMGLINGSVESVKLRGTITNTLNAMKADEKLDLIVLGGDYTSDCTIPEANWQRSKELLMNATRNAFPEGAKTPVIYVDGNHEYEVANFDNIPKLYNAGEYYTTPMKQDIGALSATDCFYETAANGSAPSPSLLVAYHYVVKGVDFVVLNTGKNYFKSAWDYSYSKESVQWCADKLAEIYAGDSDKTVFFLIHVPFSDSNSISNTNKGMNAGEAATLLKGTLAKYPNLIMLYGHDHGKDTAYLRTATEQRVTRYDSNGDKITDSPASTSYYIQNYKNSSQYLTYNTTTNMGVTTTKTEGTVASSSLVSGTMYISFPGISDTRYMHCGSSGRFSGNTALSANSSLYTYKVVDPSAATVVANKVSKIENGGSYVFVALSSAGSYYMLTDEIYGSGADQRMVGSKISTAAPGDQITFTPSGSYSPIWKLTDTKAPEPVDVTYSVKNYNTSKYLGFDSWNLTTKSAKSVCTFAASTVTSGAFTLHVEGAPTMNPYLYCGSSGRFSGNGDNTLANSQVELFKVENPAAATITGTKVTAFKGGETYLMVIKRSEGYYMLTNEMYQAGTDNQRMVGKSVTVSGGKITYTPDSNAALWTVEAEESSKPAATESFFSSFMGSMRYYSNSIEGDVSVSNSKIVQALMVYVYSDRVELHMKNYGQSGTFGSITINKELTPYTVYRNVKHSEEAKTAVPAFEGETGGSFKVNTPVSIKVTAPEGVAVYYTTDGSIPTEKSAKADKGVITWTPSVAGDYVVKVAAVEGIRLISDAVQSSVYSIKSNEREPVVEFVTSYSNAPVWYMIRVNTRTDWEGSANDERAGCWMRHDGSTVVSAPKDTEESVRLGDDSYLWRLEGSDISRVTLKSRTGNVIMSGNPEATPVPLSMVSDRLPGDNWEINMTGSSIENAALITNLGANTSGKYINLHQNGTFNAYAGEENSASALYIYPVYNTYIKVSAVTADGKAYIGEKTSTKSLDLIEGNKVVLHAVPNAGKAFSGWYIGEDKVSDKADFEISAVDITVCSVKTYVAKFKQKAATPSFVGKTGGNVAVGETVTINVESSDAGAVIYYTTDGTDPDKESATATGGVITWSPSVSGSYFVKIAATSEGKEVISDIATSGEYTVSGTSYSDICKPVIASTANSTFIKDAVLVDAAGVLGTIDFSSISQSKTQTGATPEIKAYPGATFGIKYTFESNWNDQVFYQIVNDGTTSPVKTYGTYNNAWPGDGTHGTKTGLYNMQQSGLSVDLEAQTAVLPFTLSSDLKPGDLVVIRHICAKSIDGACATANEANYVDILFRIVADNVQKYTVTLIKDGNGKVYFDSDEALTVKRVVEGESVSMHARADEGYEFTGWSALMFGVDVPLDKDTYPADLTFNDVQSDMTFTAKFTVITGVENSDADAVNIYANAGTIYIKGFSGSVQIYNIAGQITNEMNVSETASVKVEQGVYFVKADGKVVRVVVK